MNAREMFENLGYSLKADNNVLIEYSKKDCGHIDFYFIIETKRFYSRYCFPPSFQSTAHSITRDELKAVTQQAKELGWLEEEKQKTKEETNFEHYFEDLLKTGGRYAFVNGKIKHCWNTRCCDCAFKGGNCHGEKIKWLASPYEKQTYKLTQFEYDLLEHFSVDFKFKEMGLLKEMKEKGHFKNINGDELIKDILESCEVIK